MLEILELLYPLSFFSHPVYIYILYIYTGWTEKNIPLANRDNSWLELDNGIKFIGNVVKPIWSKAPNFSEIKLLVLKLLSFY